MARSFAALSFAVLLAIIEIGSCIRCYQCNSQNDGTCADYFNKKPSLLVDCATDGVLTYNNQFVTPVLPSDINVNVAGGKKLCHKIVTKSGTVIRACLDSNSIRPNQTCELLDAQNMKIEDIKKIKHCSVCDKDECNSATSVSISLPLSVLALIASYLYYKQ